MATVQHKQPAPSIVSAEDAHMLSGPTEAPMIPRAVHQPRIGRGHRIGRRSEGGMCEGVRLAHILQGSEVGVPHLTSRSNAVETSCIRKENEHIFTRSYLIALGCISSSSGISLQKHAGGRTLPLCHYYN